jgi:hypothetical protein
VRRRIVRAPVPRRSHTPIELVRDDPLHVLGDQPDRVLDDASLFAVVAAPLRLRLLILDEALEALADQLHDGVDDALLLEVAVAAAAMPIVAVVATMPVAAAVTVVVAIVASVMIAIITAVVAMVAIVAVTAIVPIVVASIVSIAVAIAPTAAVLTAAFVTAGARADEPFERLQSFEDLTPIVVSHGNPPSCRLPWPARAMQAFSPMSRHPRNASSIATVRRTVLREHAETGTPPCPTTRG